MLHVFFLNKIVKIMIVIAPLFIMKTTYFQMPCFLISARWKKHSLFLEGEILITNFKGCDVLFLLPYVKVML